jgi:hypothetical protein
MFRTEDEMGMCIIVFGIFGVHLRLFSVRFYFVVLSIVVVLVILLCRGMCE